MTSAQRRWRPSADAVLNLLAAELNSRQQGSGLPPGRSTSNVYTNEWVWSAKNRITPLSCADTAQILPITTM